jgi:uncharacterized iron-regulated membrane protein
LAHYTGFIHHLHSGEEFGLPGTIIALVSGLALMFFTLSGMWAVCADVAEPRPQRSAAPLVLAVAAQPS